MKYIIITVAAIFVVYLAYRTYRLLTLSESLVQQVNNGAVILDVRTAEEYKHGHIPGSVNMSLGTIRERYTELDPRKIYITTCSHGLRSVKAEAILKDRGFKKVFNGGAWTDLGKTIRDARKP